MKRNRINFKIMLISAFCLVAFFFVFINVYRVMIVGVHANSGTDITMYSNAANTRKVTLSSHRGYIFDRNGNIIAQDSTTYKMYAILSSSRPNSGSKPAYVEDVYYTAAVLAHVLGGEESAYVKILKQDAYQVEFGYYGNNISKDEKEEIESYDLPGIEFTEIPSRTYPLGSFASYIVGYAQYDSSEDALVGKMGIEMIYDDDLAGEDGYRKTQVNTEGYALPGSETEVVEAKDGYDIYLTLDKAIQEQLDTSLQETIDTHSRCTKAWGAVVECETGRVLAWGQAPSFDPNVLEIDDWSNVGTQYAYEPGSTMKSFTYAIAIDTGVYDGEAEFDSSTFLMGISGGKPIRVWPGSGARVYGTINNSRNRTYGMINYDTGYRYSSNVGIASLLCNYIDIATYKEYLEKFGFWQKVGMNGFAEVAGIKNLTYPIEILTSGFGQGSSVTMLQLIQAYSAIFNDGEMLKPYVVEQIKDTNTGETVFLAEKEVVGNPISEETAKQVQGLMWDVINASDGTGSHYKVSDVEVIGKTGTAEVSGDSRVISSVMMAFPADDPKIMVYYAFISAYNTMLHVNTDPILNVVKKAAVVCGYTTAEVEPIAQTVTVEKEIYTMENYLNHSLKYVYDVDNQKDLDYVILGNGTQVIDQYPKAGDKVVSGQKVFLLTSNDSVKMPNMIGCSRKEVMALWDLCGLAVAIEGDGFVVSQSIPEGTLIYPNSLLEVTLE